MQIGYSRSFRWPWSLRTEIIHYQMVDCTSSLRADLPFHQPSLESSRHGKPDVMQTEPKESGNLINQLSHVHSIKRWRNSNNWSVAADRAAWQSRDPFGCSGKCFWPIGSAWKRARWVRCVHYVLHPRSCILERTADESVLGQVRLQYASDVSLESVVLFVLFRPGWSFLLASGTDFFLPFLQ